MNELQTIEYQNQRVLTTQQLAESYETSPEILTRNFNRNKERYQEGRQYFLLEGEELKEFKMTTSQFGGSPNRINKLYLWTEKGALLHAKSLSTDKAWEVYDILVDTYFKAHELKASLENLSPELQFMIKTEMKQKELEKQVNQVSQQVSEQGEKIDSIKDVVSLSSTEWRKDTTILINKIARHLGGMENIRFLREESYNLLNERMGVSIQTRLTNRKRRMSLEGASKSSINKQNFLDVIADDKKLIEGYVSIVKDMAIKYGIAVD